MGENGTYYRSFVTLLIVVSLAFGWLLLPYYSAIFWGAVLAVSFSPLHRRITERFPRYPNLSALATLLICLVIVIFPLLVLISALLREGALIYQRLESGELSLGLYYERIVDALPDSVHQLLQELGLGDMFSLQEKLSAGALEGSKFIAGQAVNIGQNTAGVLISLGIMLYLLFFLLRDGAHLARTVKLLMPLDDEHKLMLIQKFITVVRATIKGNIVVAATQGALGGFIFWVLGIEGALLWGVIMAFLSLLPAVGAAIIWFPVAVYFLVTGAYVDATILIAFGVFVIGLVDNILRPLLVGKDTKMPDYVVLVSTLGGLATFGLNGFVIGPLLAALFMSVWSLFPAAIKTHHGR
ncbi:AI-2E family transporter [Neopusillimonas maritima]|uniref:AI-2E family transporter n=1 Tax=Neopusillimonas maritima TaxID=2026239 RepID=A0ABX9MYF6_9BURK|nr:AI-2E family transporter [Neopusillimonas maritima]RII84014.1 AI-2E family transporter [Neopusillimonas maritima]